MPFDIHRVPFYNAVALFEAENYTEAFNIFLECAEKGNLYAVFYIDYILNTLRPSDLILPEGRLFLKNLQERLEQIPRGHHPEAWCKASVCIQRYKKETREKFRHKILKELESLAALASNAGIFVLSQLTDQERLKLGTQTGKQGKLLQKIMRIADLFVVYHLNKMNIVSLDALQEWPIIEKFAELSYTTSGGNLERLVAKYYMPGTKGGFNANGIRLYQWQITGAYIGCKEIQFMFSTPGPNKRSDLEMDQWLKLAAEQGHVQAQIMYGIDSSKKGDGYTAKIFLEMGTRKATPSSVSDLLLSQAYLQLGKMQEDGEGGFEKNDIEALKFYQRSEALGFPVAMSNIAVFYEFGRGGLEQNYPNAIAQYQKAIAMSNGILTEKTMGTLYGNIANLYAKGGCGLKPDYKLAIENYKKSIAHHPTTFQLSECGRLLLTKIEGVENLPEGLRLLTLAAKQGDACAAYTLARFYIQEKKNPASQYQLPNPKILNYLKLALTEESSHIIEQCHSLMGIFYHDVVIPPDLKSAYECFRVGALKNEPTSLSRLGSLYEHGCEVLAMKPDLKTAFEYYQRAAELGDPISLSNAGFCLVNGLGVVKDASKGREYLEKALAMGAIGAAYNLSFLYRNGNGVEQDYKKAFEYLKMAESTEDADVLFDIGLAYHSGRGVQRDPALALRYYEQSMKLGNHAAAHNYVSIKLNYAVGQGVLTEELIIELLDKLALPMQKGFAIDIFLHCMLTLCLDPSQKTLVMDRLRTSIALKPHKPSLIALEYLQRCKHLTGQDAIIILASKDPLAVLDELEKKKSCETSEKKKQAEPAGSSLALMTKTKLSQYQQTVDEFIEPKNIKGVDFKKFMHLLNDIATIEGMELEITPSKSSNINLRLCSGKSAKTLCFSYHPTHRSGSGPDAEFDPKRARSLQTFIKTAAGISGGF